MAEEKVFISYKILVENIQALEDYKRKHQEAVGEVEGLKEKIKTLNDTQEKQESIMKRGRKAVLDLRKEMFLLSLAVGTVVASLAAIAKQSDSLGAHIERSGDELQRFAKNLGDIIAASGLLLPVIGTFKALADVMQKLNSFVQSKKPGAGQGETAAAGILIDSLRARTLQSQGNSVAALNLQLDIEFLQKIQDQLAKGGSGVDRLRAAWVNYRREAVDALRRSELGLKTNIEIMKDFQRSIADAFAGGVSEPIFKFLQGEQQSGTDILKGFQTGINRSVADAIGQALKSSIFGGGFGDFFSNLKSAFTGDNTPQVKATKAVEERIKTMNENVSRVRECICRTAENTGFMAANAGRGGISGITATIEGGGGSSALGKIGAISGAIASIGGLFKGSGVGGGGGEGPGSIEYAPGPARHSGGFVGSFQTGGEVPITAQRGEFVVRKSVAQDNKEFLKDFNLHGEAKRSGSGPVFLIKANDAKSFDDQLSSPAARSRMEIQIMRAIMMNGSIRNIIRDFAR